jgi:hypothetical protein
VDLFFLFRGSIQVSTLQRTKRVAILKCDMIETQCIHRNLLGQIFLHVFWKFCSGLRPEKLFTTLTFTEISTVEVYIHHTYTESDSQILGLRPFRSEAARIFADYRKTIGILGLVSVNRITR